MKWLLPSVGLLALGCAGQAPPSDPPVAREKPPVRQTGPPVKPSVRRKHPLATLRRVELAIDGKTVEVYVADNESTTTEGLMFISDDELQENQGMIFVFPESRELSFWMRNTIIALDIAYLDESGRVLNVLTMQPLDDVTKNPSAGPAKYAIEMKAGWFSRNGVTTGARVDLQPLR